MNRLLLLSTRSSIPLWVWCPQCAPRNIVDCEGTAHSRLAPRRGDLTLTDLLLPLALPSLLAQKPPHVIPSTAVEPVAWYIPVSVALGGTLLLAAGLGFAWYRLGPQLLAMRAAAAKKRPPGSAKPGGAVTLVLTDVEGSTELW